MKNIYILPTDKPSRIIKSQDNDFILLNTDAPNWFEINLKTTKQHIYITSDEEIKEGDWIFQECLNMPHRLIKTDAENVKVLNNLNKCKKIILTTDQDLIKDGVQAIDDEFLEGFVKNPSCEKVEVRKIEDELISPKNQRIRFNALQDPPLFISAESLNNMILTYKYKIIIPKEELQTECYCEKTLWCDCKPKQESILKCDICKMYPRLEGTNKCESCYSSVRHVLEQAPELKEHLLPELRKEQETSSVGAENQIFKIVLDEKCRPNKVSMIETDNNSVLNKQETLEEAAKSHAIYELENNYKPTKESFKLACKRNFIRGAKWQQEQDKNKYSEEDLISLLEFNYKKETNQLGTLRKDYSQKIVKEWFEQFKKK